MPGDSKANRLGFYQIDRDDVASEIDEHKNDQLEKQKKGQGHWKGELASQSEAAVR